MILIWAELEVLFCRVGVVGPRVDDRLRLWRRTRLCDRRKTVRRGSERRACWEPLSARMPCSNGAGIQRIRLYRCRGISGGYRIEGTDEQILQVLIPKEVP